MNHHPANILTNELPTMGIVSNCKNDGCPATDALRQELRSAIHHVPNKRRKLDREAPCMSMSMTQILFHLPSNSSPHESNAAEDCIFPPLSIFPSFDFEEELKEEDKSSSSCTNTSSSINTYSTISSALRICNSGLGNNSHKRPRHPGMVRSPTIRSNHTSKTTSLWALSA
jgi:hypothetical protein